MIVARRTRIGLARPRLTNWVSRRPLIGQPTCPDWFAHLAFTPTPDSFGNRE